jgi:hypothetical protein
MRDCESITNQTTAVEMCRHPMHAYAMRGDSTSGLIGRYITHTTEVAIAIG